MVACNPGQEECTAVDTQFDFGIRLGLVFVVESAALSLIAVGGLLTYILVRSQSAIIPRWRVH